MAPLHVVMLLTLSISPYVLAVAKLPSAPPGKTMAFSKVFDVDFTTDANGGCKSYRDKLEPAYAETMDMIYQATEALDWLSRLKTIPDKKKDLVNYNNYLRIIQLYEKTLSIMPYSSRRQGLDPDAKEVLGVYQKYLAAHQVDERRASKKYYLRCGDDWLVWTRPNDADPREDQPGNPPKYTLAKPKPPKKPFPKGGFYLPGLPKEKSMLDFDEESNYGKKNPICQNEAQAATFYANDLIIFCPGQLKESKRWSLEQIQPAAKSGILGKNPATNIDVAKTTITLNWMHELGHLVENFDDPLAVDANGHNLGREKWGDWTRVYYWKRVVDYAKTRADEVAKSPENLAYFAVGLYMKDFYWASGQAKTKPESDDAAGSSSRKRSHGATLPASSSIASDGPEHSKRAPVATLPAPRKGWTWDIEKVFDVDFTTDQNGGCKMYQDRLRTSMVEAVAMMRDAMDAIDELSQVKRAPSSTKTAEYNNWLRVRQVYQKVFGSDPWTSLGGLADGAGHRRHMYDVMLGALQAKVGLKGHVHSLRCGDDFFKWLEPNDPDPREAGKADATKFTLAKPRGDNKPYPKGAYHATGIKPVYLHYESGFEKTEPKENPFCRKRAQGNEIRDTSGAAFQKTGLLVFCPFSLNYRKWSMDENPPTAGTWNTVKFVGASSLEDPRVAAFKLAMVWVHELCHLVPALDDPVAVDRNGKPLPLIDGYAPVVYGWEKVVDLARHRKQDAVRAPDCYAYFAAAMYWKELYWASGVAKTYPEREAPKEGGDGVAGPSKQTGRSISMRF